MKLFSHPDVAGFEMKEAMLVTCAALSFPRKKSLRQLDAPLFAEDLFEQRHLARLHGDFVPKRRASARLSYVIDAFRNISAACFRVASVILMPPSIRAISSTRVLSVSRVIDVVATPSIAVFAT